MLAIQRTPENRWLTVVLQYRLVYYFVALKMASMLVCRWWWPAYFDTLGWQWRTCHIEGSCLWNYSHNV